MSPANPQPTTSPIDLRLALLLGQGLFLGFAVAMWYVAANTLFLVDWGAARLPWVYIGIAIVVSAISYGLTVLQRRWTTARVVLFIGLVLAIFVSGARLGLLLPSTRPVSLILMIGYYLAIQMVFVSLGLVAGRLFDIREMKRYFPMLIAGLNGGFIVGGLSTVFLTSLLGGAQNLLVVAAAGLLASLLLQSVLVARFRAALTQSATAASAQPRRPLIQLLRQRYIARTFLYQMLSAVGSMLIVFILIAQAEIQFPNATDLAQFFGVFGSVRNITNILFAMTLAGWLLNRFGLRFGLSANPAGVGGMVLVMLAAGMAMTTDSALFFWLAVATMGLDVILTESITVPSLKTVYQALPGQERDQVETVVEGMGVPIAYGIAGVILLILNAIPGLTTMHIGVFALLVIVPWLIAGVLLYRDYAGALLQTLSRRALGTEELSLADSSSLRVVERLLQSPKLGDVRLALDVLEQAEAETMTSYLTQLLSAPPRAGALSPPDPTTAPKGHPNDEMRTEALQRIARLRLTNALPAVEQCLRTQLPPAVKGAALQALCALAEADAVERVLPYLEDEAPPVRQGAMVGLLRYGGIPGILAAGQRLTALEDDPDPRQRAAVAHIIGAVGMSSFYQPLLPLLRDADPEVRRAALLAAGQCTHPRLLPALIDNLAAANTRSAAMTALTASGDLVLPVVEQALTGEAAYDIETRRRLVRLCGQIKGAGIVNLFTQHLDHPHHELQQQVLQVLYLCGYRAAEPDYPRLAAAVDNNLCHGLRILMADAALGENGEFSMLQAALRQEFSAARQRIFLLLSYRYEPRALRRAEEHLVRGSRADKALAIETFDVILTGEQKAPILAMIDESLALPRRTDTLQQRFAQPTLDQDAWLAAIITDTAHWTHSWTRACALYAAGRLAREGMAPAVETTLALADPPIPETATWALSRLTSAPPEHSIQ